MRVTINHMKRLAISSYKERASPSPPPEGAWQIWTRREDLSQPQPRPCLMSGQRHQRHLRYTNPQMDGTIPPRDPPPWRLPNSNSVNQPSVPDVTLRPIRHGDSCVWLPLTENTRQTLPVPLEEDTRKAEKRPPRPTTKKPDLPPIPRIPQNRAEKSSARTAGHLCLVIGSCLKWPEMEGMTTRRMNGHHSLESRGKKERRGK
ncbi:hypothetical protein B0H67DRAFT_294812 [Lasiosphaeris hirsuta]|uniref:Uncharacterized protein n=1 Tax=Lasiosphaeris hirsuta TaxID=260670 RepID=A0AA40A990_9PEZI|nr:hypothetical protein B0H67DRAFT_294812 [Lasiosphaeris hirsuta]